LGRTIGLSVEENIVKLYTGSFIPTLFKHESGTIIHTVAIQKETNTAANLGAILAFFFTPA